MDFTPNSEVRLLGGVPLTLNNNNQLYFDNKTAQTNYFLSKTVKTYNNQSYQRKERGVFYCSDNAESLWNVNYIMYRNTNFGNKWFYGYVTKIEYIDPNRTDVHFATDPFQTWLFDINFKQSFVEREHTLLYNADGTPVLNTLDEGLNYGTEYQIVGSYSSTQVDGVNFCILCTKIDILHDINDSVAWETQPIGGVVQSLHYYVIPFTNLGTTFMVNGKPVSKLGDVLFKLQTDSKLNDMNVSLTITSQLPFTTTGNNMGISCKALSVQEGNTLVLAKVLDNDFEDILYDSGNKYSGFPKYQESKLLMYPYSYTELTDFKGHTFTIKNEYVEGTNLQIVGQSNINFKSKNAYLVKNYNNGGVNLEWGIIDDNTNELPVVDDYTAGYVQSNKNSQNVAMANSMVDYGQRVASSVATTVMASAINPALGAISFLGSAVNATVDESQDIASKVAKTKDIYNIAPTLSAQGNDITFSYGNGYYGFFLIKKTIEKEYAEILSDYFRRFGYKVHRLKVPNLHTRKSWNYVKTLSCTITGSVPQDDLNTIRKIFNTGVTLWHTDDVGNYMLDNSPL